MPHSSPRHKGPPPPRRLLAIGGAALVTVVSVAGGLGIGPGAALGKTTAPPTAKLPSSIAQQDSAGGSSDSTSTDGSGHSWLTVDHDKADTSGSDANPGGGGGSDPPSIPELPARSGHGKRIVFDMGDQRVWLVNGHGDVIRTYLVSGSLHDNLQAGTYDVYSKSHDAVSFDGNETMRFMVRFTQGETAAIGFHDIPRRPDGSLVETHAQLGTPQSAGCVRQWEPDAKALWKFAPVGTKVVVTA